MQLSEAEDRPLSLPFAAVYEGGISHAAPAGGLGVTRVRWPRVILVLVHSVMSGT